MAYEQAVWLNRGRLARLVDFKTLSLVSAALLVAALALVPLFFLVWNSFKEVGVGRVADFSLTNFTLANYVTAFGSPKTINMMANSFVFATGTLAVAFFFGATIAFLVERTNAPFRNVVFSFMLIPLIMPSFILAIAWSLLLQPRIGLLNVAATALGLVPPFTSYSMPAMWWVEGLSLSPLAFLLLGSSLRMMDSSLEEAASMCGAGKLTTFTTVSLRLAAPAAAGVALLTFVRALESFDVPLIMGLGGQIVVFSTLIWANTTGMESPDYGLALASSMLLVALAGIGVILYLRIISRAEKYATVTGKGFRPSVTDLGRFRWIAGAFMVFFALVSVVIPLLVLLWASLLPLYQVPSPQALSTLSFDHYRNILGSRKFLSVIENTAIVGGTVAVGGMLLASLVSWVVIRLRPRGTRILDLLAFAPYAIPGIVIGFAYMVLLLTLQSPIYGTVWALILGYGVAFFPIATRFSHAGMAQISAELEDSAAIAGAGFLSTLTRITLPLMLPALLGGGIYLFLLCTKVLSVGAILFSTRATILPTYIIELYRLPSSIGQVSAIALMMVIVLTILTLMARRIARASALAVAA